MSVITVLRVVVARAFSIVLLERFLTTHSEVGKRYDHHGSSWENTLVNIQDAGIVQLYEFSAFTYTVWWQAIKPFKHYEKKGGKLLAIIATAWCGPACRVFGSWGG